MSLPDFQSILLPLLKLTASREELTSADSYRLMAEHFRLSEAEVEALMPSGRGSLFRNRVAWAKQYLMFAQLVEPTRRGVSRSRSLVANGAASELRHSKSRISKAFPDSMSARMAQPELPAQTPMLPLPTPARLLPPIPLRPHSLRLRNVCNSPMPNSDRAWLPRCLTASAGSRPLSLSTW